ncbi:MAG: polysaccharide biosynthesis tyrosine autokinase [Dysgonamonadaceae bacterium]|jgi:capsular exopolysaccharide synthesis family protein|nr:polysaccharide biosynthesis tyrosine autokinase [Dysgonamonadaceae bacterium]
MNNEYDHPNNVNSEEISLVETLFHYFSYWKLFVIFVIACLAIAGAYLFYATPQYRVVLRVLVNDDKKGQSIMDFSTFSDLGISAPKSFMDNEIEVLRSETLLRNVADSLHLEVSYFVDNGFKRNEIYKNTPVFVSIASVEASGYFTIEKVDANTLSIHSRKEDFDRIVKIGENVISPWGLLNFKDNPFGTVPYPITVVINDPEDYLPVINIVPTSKSSSVVEISMVTANIRKGRDIINSLINLYNQNAINEKNYVAKNTISFINERLDVIAQELGSAEKEVESYRKEQGITDLEAQGKLLLSSSGEYNQKINEAEIQLNILLNIKEFLSQASNAGNLLPANIGLSDPTILSLIAGYNKVILEKQSSTAGMNENMSMVIEYNKQIAQIKDDLLKGINFAENASRLTIRELHKQESMYLGLARELSTKERESRELIRQQTIKEQLFIYLLQKKEETGLSLAMATPNAKIIDESSPLKKVSPQTAILLLAALFSGLVFPIVIIYIKDLFDNRVHTKDDIMRTVKAPFLGEIPFAKDSSDPFPVLKVRSSIAEKFRIITSNLGFIVGELQTKVISVTSATPGDGKSFVARNLALSLATNGKRTLLIDLDIRKSVLMETLHIESQSGSVYYLSNPSVKFSEIVHIGKYHKNLDIIPVKVYPPNPSELLESERLAMLFKEVDKLYEYIIVDTAPVGLVADVYTINPFVTATLYVVRADHTYKQALLDIRDIYQAKKLNNLTCVLNAIPMSKRYGYGYNDYAYKHSYYTEE